MYDRIESKWSTDTGSDTPTIHLLAGPSIIGEMEAEGNRGKLRGSVGKSC